MRKFLDKQMLPFAAEFQLGKFRKPGIFSMLFRNFQSFQRLTYISLQLLKWTGDIHFKWGEMHVNSFQRNNEAVMT